MFTFKTTLRLAVWAMALLFVTPVLAQQPESMYGDEVKADVKMKYVYTMEEAIDLSMKNNKPIFVNCFQDWAVPCHGMNKMVFSDQAFADYMDQNFVCLFLNMADASNKSFGEQYNIQSYAHYLVLDADGNLLLRMVGGEKLPGFQESVSLALNPLTSLKGATEAYQSGKRDKQTILNYLNVLRLSDQDSLYKAIDSTYIPMLDPSEYSKKENWKHFTELIRSIDNDYYRYYSNHRADFVKESGDEVTTKFDESLFSYIIYPYAAGGVDYDSMKLLDCYRQMKKVGLPDSSVIWNIYQIAKLRGEKKDAELYAYLKANRKALGRYAIYIDTSLGKGELDDTRKDLLVAYLKDAMALEEGSRNKNFLQNMITELTSVTGIAFEKELTFQQVLDKAKAQGKKVFMDCYTSWCGPCKMMASQVFTQDKVGKHFNAGYINLKMDMEKGEGKDLAKRYKITGYPTMLVLDAEGNEIRRIVGACSADDLIKKAEGAE